ARRAPATGVAPPRVEPPSRRGAGRGLARALDRARASNACEEPPGARPPSRGILRRPGRAVRRDRESPGRARAVGYRIDPGRLRWRRTLGACRRIGTARWRRGLWLLAGARMAPVEGAGRELVQHVPTGS